MIENAKLLFFHIDYFRDQQTVEGLIQHLYDWQALHVQVMHTTNRHGTPAYSFFVESPVDREWQIAHNLAKEYGISRYHRMETTFNYQPLQRIERPIVVVCGEHQLGLTIRFSLIGTEREATYVRVEETALDALHSRLEETCGFAIDLADLRRRLETLLMREEGFVLELEG